MERIWRLLVAIFFLCAGVALIAFSWIFENTIVAAICIYAALVFIPIGIIKGFYDVFHFGSTDEDRKE